MFCKSRPLPRLPNNKSLDLFFIFLKMSPCEYWMLGMRLFLQTESAPLWTISVDQATFVPQSEHYLADAETHPAKPINNEVHAEEIAIKPSQTGQRPREGWKGTSFMMPPHQAKPVTCAHSCFRGNQASGSEVAVEEKRRPCIRFLGLLKQNITEWGASTRCLFTVLEAGSPRSNCQQVRFPKAGPLGSRMAVFSLCPPRSFLCAPLWCPPTCLSVLFVQGHPAERMRAASV